MKNIHCLLVILLLSSGEWVYPCSLHPESPCKMDVISPKDTLKDTVIKDIPTQKVRGGGRQPVGYYYAKAPLEEKIGLPSLEDGFDSLTIRIWYGYSNAVDTLQMVTIQNTAGKWKGKIYLLPLHKDHDTDSILSVDRQFEEASPRSGWNSFTKRLFKSNILTLPDMGKIPHYPIVPGGHSVIIEIATKKLYRIYSYSVVELAAKDIKQARSVEEILRMISKEFNFRQLYGI